MRYVHHQASYKPTPKLHSTISSKGRYDWELYLSAASASPDAAEWYTSKIVSNAPNAEGLRSIDIEVSSDVASTYEHPGQYVKVKIGDMKPSFFAIASPPDDRNVLSFLIKESPSNDFILNCATGASVDLSLPQGRGFQIDEYFNNYKKDFPVNSILLMACGSGIAPIAAALDSGKLGLKETSYESIFARKAKLYIGAKTESHLPFAEKYAEWAEKGVQVIPVLSQEGKGESAESKTGGGGGGGAGAAAGSLPMRRGYIQDALREDAVPVPKNCAVLLCGMRDMTDNVKELCLEAGVYEGRILLNF